MTRTIARAIACIAAGSSIPFLAFGLLNLVGEALSPLSLLRGSPLLLRLLVWSVPVLLCAFGIGRLARLNAFLYGLLAGVSASLCLLIVATTREFSRGDSIAPLAQFLLPELTLTLLLLPLASIVLMRRRTA